MRCTQDDGPAVRQSRALPLQVSRLATSQALESRSRVTGLLGGDYRCGQTGVDGAVFVQQTSVKQAIDEAQIKGALKAVRHLTRSVCQAYLGADALRGSLEDQVVALQHIHRTGLPRGWNRERRGGNMPNFARFKEREAGRKRGVRYSQNLGSTNLFVFSAL